MEKKVSFDFPVDILKKSEQQGEFHVVGYASVSDVVDLQNDRITDDALKNSETDLLTNSTVLLNHDPEKPIGKVIKSEFDDHGLLIDVLISKTEADIIEKIREQILNKFSIRGQILSRSKEWDENLGQEINVIEKMSLIEVSVVSVPANSEAKAIGFYVTKSLREFDESENSKVGDTPISKGGDPMPKDNSKKKEEISKSDPNPEVKKNEEPNNPTPSPTPQPAPAPTPSDPTPPAPTPSPEPGKEEAQKNLVEAVRSALEPVFGKLALLIEMGGDSGAIAQEIWMMLKSIAGESSPSADMPKAMPKQLSQGEIGKLISTEVSKQVETILKSVPTLRKGVIQNEDKKEDIQKTFDGLTPDKKLRVALATLNK